MRPDDERRALGPPFAENAVATPPAPAPIERADRRPDGIAARRQCTCSHPPRRYADAWKSGFAYGYHDALRLVGRRLPVEHWPIVETLAEQYTWVGGDG